MSKKHKYYRVTANSMTSFELYMKVPDSITTDDIWMQRGNEILEGSRFKAMDNGWPMPEIIALDQKNRFKRLLELLDEKE